MEVLEDFGDDFSMQTISKETMEFPIVIKRVVDQIILSVPDLAIYKYLNISELEINSENSSISAKLGKEIEKLSKELDIPFIETSAKRNLNVSSMFAGMN